MSEFKGTKGKWYHQRGTSSIWHPNIEGLRIAIIEDTVYRSSITIEGKANALLISKAPEMLGEINESIKDLLCMQVSINEAMKLDNRWEGMYDFLQKQIDRKKKLIKSATEI